MRYALKLAVVFLCFVAAPAYAIRPQPADAGTSVPEPPADTGTTMVDTGATAIDADPSTGDAGYPDTGCPDGVCCLVLPDFDANFDTGPVDTGRRRRRVVTVDAGDDVPNDGMFGCSASGASSLLWLLPLLATRRRRS